MNQRSAMKIRFFFLTFLSLTAVPLRARKASDLLVMKNGDRLTCEVKSLNGGVLSVNLDYVDGTLAVDWSEVARLESSQLFVVLAQDGSSHEGTLSTAEAPSGAPTTIRVTEAMGKVVEIDRSQVVRMTQTSERFYQRFSGAINLGINYSKGNNATQYSFGTEAQYLRERWSAEAIFNSNLSANSGSTTSTRNQLGFRGYHLLPWNNYFYGGVADFLQSSVQGINIQTTLGGGIGRFLKNTNRATISVLGGLSWQATNYNASATTNGTENVGAALVAAEIKLFKFKRTNLGVTAILLPALTDPGRVRFNTNATYYLKLFNNLNWNVSFYENWDSRPPTGFSSSDYGTSSGLSWTFGNR
jgi:Protein of unknown function, DUF481